MPAIAEPAAAVPPAFPTALAARCVACGLCLPHCPTYLKTRRETESPRGRIALMQGLASGDLELTPTLTAHLDHCLACRSCEAVCPSRVPYGQLIDSTRAVQAARHAPSWLHRAALALLGSPPGLQRAQRWLRRYQRSGFAWLARRSGLLALTGLGALEAQLPPVPRVRPLAAAYPSHGPAQGAVALFTGCVQSVLDRDSIEAAIRVLNALGYTVHVPAGQACCGALHLHGGDPAGARALAERNLAAFAGTAPDAVLYLASGCGATLAEYAQQLPQAAGFAGRVMEATRFVNEAEWPVAPAPLAARVAVHAPCTHRNVVGGTRHVTALLARIPELEVMTLAPATRCCGAAGTYFLEYPRMAAELRADVLAAAQPGRPQYLATTNIGCALHLAAGLRGDSAAPEVVHPLRLLDRALAAGAAGG